MSYRSSKFPTRRSSYSAGSRSPIWEATRYERAPVSKYVYSPTEGYIFQRQSPLLCRKALESMGYDPDHPRENGRFVSKSSLSNACFSPQKRNGTRKLSKVPSRPKAIIKASHIRSTDSRYITKNTVSSATKYTPSMYHEHRVKLTSAPKYRVYKAHLE